MNPPLKVSGLDHVALHVKDLPRARKFYVEFLGMEVDHEKGWQCFLKCGNQGVALFEVDDDEAVHAGSEINHIALRLAAGELAGVKATLENAGIAVRGRANDQQCIYFDDPDGHQLQLLTPNE